MQANSAKKRFVSPEGDHLTLVQVFGAYLEEGAKQDPGRNDGDMGNKRRKVRTRKVLPCRF